MPIHTSFGIPRPHLNAAQPAVLLASRPLTLDAPSASHNTVTASRISNAHPSAPRESIAAYDPSGPLHERALDWPRPRRRRSAEQHADKVERNEATNPPEAGPAPQAQSSPAPSQGPIRNTLFNAIARDCTRGTASTTCSKHPPTPDLESVPGHPSSRARRALAMPTAPCHRPRVTSSLSAANG